MSFVALNRPAAHVARLTIETPGRNALGRAARAELAAHLDALECDLDVRAVVLTGAGETFCSGDDLRELHAAGGATPEGFAAWARLFDRLERLRPPTIAAVDGWAVGGGLELAACCDLRLAADRAQFTAAGVSNGIVASVWRLPRLIGPARAKAMLLTGSPVDAPTALAWGLVTALHPPEVLADAALAVAARIASRAPLAVEATKTLASNALDLPRDQGLARMAAAQERLAATADHAEALAAFAEKRAPQFRRA